VGTPEVGRWVTLFRLGRPDTTRRRGPPNDRSGCEPGPVHYPDICGPPPVRRRVCAWPKSVGRPGVVA
jgi:hypothetical protein